MFVLFYRLIITIHLKRGPGIDEWTCLQTNGTAWRPFKSKLLCHFFNLSIIPIWFLLQKLLKRRLIRWVRGWKIFTRIVRFLPIIMSLSFLRFWMNAGRKSLLNRRWKQIWETGRKCLQLHGVAIFVLWRFSSLCSYLQVVCNMFSKSIII